MNILKDIFTNTLNNELQTITYNNESYTCFFRRNDSSSDKTYTTVYFPVEKYIPQGAMFTYGADTYLVTKLVTTENNVYKKAQAIKCNSEFKIIYAKADIVTYKCYMSEFIDSLSTSGDAITLDSTVEFILELNDDTKRLLINKRFFCGYLGIAWVINEINYREGLCYIYCERSPIVSNDDTTNYIADRWYYESDTTDKYKVTTTSSSYTITNGETATIGAKLTKNDTTIDSNLIVWTIKDSTICSIADDTITALSVGVTTVTGSYKASVNDTCTDATFTVEVIEKKEEVEQTGHIAYVDKDTVNLCIGETESDTVKVTFTMNGAFL